MWNIVVEERPQTGHKAENLVRGPAPGGFDRFLRRKDTWPARLVDLLAPQRGHAYLASRAKRRLDLLVALPALVAATPFIVLLALVNRFLQPSHDAFFTQERADHGGRRLRIVKIRSMLPESSPAELRGFERFLRRYYLDELPQLAQVMSGRLSLVGIRVLPFTVLDRLQREWSPRRWASWWAAYNRTPLGLTGIHQVYRSAGKEDLRRYHRDVFYARSASLGLDLYLIWRTLRRAGR